MLCCGRVVCSVCVVCVVCLGVCLCVCSVCKCCECFVLWACVLVVWVDLGFYGLAITSPILKSKFFPEISSKHKSSQSVEGQAENC